MKISERALNVLKELEGLRLKPYKDAAGKLTIGYGHLIKIPIDNKIFKVTGKNIVPELTLIEASNLLLLDLEGFERLVTTIFDKEIPQEHFDALVLFAFNLGIGRLMGSTLLKKYLKNDYAGIDREFLKWINVTINGKLKPVEGLKIRRAVEASIFKGGLIAIELKKSSMDRLKYVYNLYRGQG